MAWLPWYARLVLSVAGAGLLALLAIAWSLNPNPEGLGTHQQLGLPTCTFLQLTGIRCPSCGMTTSWSHMVRGQFIQALRANSGGALLAVIAAVTGPWMLASGLLGRWVVKPDHRILLTALVAALAVTLIDWGIRLTY